jgi:hypothetical protein
VTNGGYVTWDRWDAEHEALSARVTALEHQLERKAATAEHEAEMRRTNEWVLIGAVLSGIVFPLLLTAVLTLVHLHGRLSPAGCGSRSLLSSPA